VRHSGSSASGQETEVVRLTRERDEALERETATSEVLRVISSSPGELEPVFQAILESATRICEAKLGGLFRFGSDGPTIVASIGIPAKVSRLLQSKVQLIGPYNAISRLWKTRRLVHIADYSADEAYLKRDPMAVAGVEMGGVRTLLNVPMLKDDELIGFIGMFRQEVRPSPISRSNCYKTLPLRPLSPSRTRGCSMNCGNRCSSKPRPLMCSS
jgi:GAF domain-containing protein